MKPILQLVSKPIPLDVIAALRALDQAFQIEDGRDEGPVIGSRVPDSADLWIWRSSVGMVGYAVFERCSLLAEQHGADRTLLLRVYLLPAHRRQGLVLAAVRLWTKHYGVVIPVKPNRAWKALIAKAS